MSALSGGMAADEQRTKRSAKKPAWMTNDEMLIDPAEVEAEVKMPRPQVRKPHPAHHEMAHRLVVPAHHHEVLMQRPMRPAGRMCSNPQCKNPYDSPQWRRGPLGPGTLCNACGTRYARLQAKMSGDKKGKMRPQERVEWDAFEQQRLHPQVPQHQQQQQNWRMHMQHFVQHEHQQQQYYGHEQEDYGGYEDGSDGYGAYDERSYSSQQQAAAMLHSSQQQQMMYGAMEEDGHDPEATEDGQLMCQEGLPDSPDVASRTAVAAAVAAAAAAAAAGAQRPSSRTVWRGSRQHFPAADAATDSQEDEAAAYSCQDTPAAGDAAAAAGSPAGPSFLHLIAVGEAMIKTEGVAQQDRHAAWTEVVGKGLGPQQPDKAPARAAGGEAAQGVKRSRFALEAEEQQGGRPAASAEPTALQRALERFGQQPATAAPQRSKPAATADGHAVPSDRFERLLAEAEACVRARSVSPCMLKGVPGSGASPTCNMPAPRPITPLQLGLNAVDAASGRGGAHGLAAFMLPGAAMPRRPHSAAAAADGHSSRSRHSSLAQALAAAAAAEDADAGAHAEAGGMHQQQGSPASQLESNAASLANRRNAAQAAGEYDDDGDGDVDAHDRAAAAAAAAGYQHDGHYGAFMAPGMQEQYEALVSQMRGGAPSSEPSPMSKMLLADEVLSPTTMNMGTSARPRKQARTQGPASMGVAGAAGGSSQLRQLQPREQARTSSADAAAAAAAAAAGYQHAHMASHLMAPQWAGLHPMLMHQDSTQGQQQQGVATAGSGSLPSAAELQQAGHHSVMLACQLVLQQQANPTSLFQGQAQAGAAGQGNNPSGGMQQGGELGAGGAGNAQTHLDQLKAVTLSAQAAAATASAVAAATELLWRQLQQQERERERQREREREEQLQQAQQLEQQQQEPHSDSQAAMPDAEDQQQAPADVEAGVGDAGNGPAAAAAAAAEAAAEPAAPGSPVADPAAAQAASGSISRSSSSSVSAAGLAAAPVESESVNKQADAQAADAEHQQQQQQPGPDTEASPAEADDLPADAGIAAPAADAAGSDDADTTVAAAEGAAAGSAAAEPTNPTGAEA